MEVFKLELIESHELINLYSIRFNGHEHTEFEKFILKFPEGSDYEKDIDIIISWLDNIIKKGALERYFRNESRYGSGVKAIPVVTSKLRLYCYRMSDKILILGNGAIKDTATWQDSKSLSVHVKLLIDTENFISYRIENNSITIKNDKEIIGNLTFKRQSNEKK